MLTFPSIVATVSWEQWLPHSLLEALRPEQKEACNHCIKCVTGVRNKHELGAILAFAMGLGKTLITLAVLTALFNAPPTSRVLRALIVCPARLVRNWVAEVAKWLPLSRCTFSTLDAPI